MDTSKVPHSELSFPSKMPGAAWGIPARSCITGAKLRPVVGTTCSKCYALKGRYVTPVVLAAYQRRLDELSGLSWSHQDRQLWVARMVERIKNARPPRGGRPDFDPTHFRWFDSGDLQSGEHLRQIIDVAWQTPGIKHWLPTREARFVKEALWGSDTWEATRVPSNLTIRTSAVGPGTPPPTWGDAWDLPNSCVTTGAAHFGRLCPASGQDGKCATCRNCWDPKVQVVTYPLH